MSNMPTKALSVRQPWAWAIIHAGKDVENRTRRTLFRGDFYIHASKGMTLAEYHAFIDFYANIKGEYNDAILQTPLPEDLERGGIIGIATLSDCVEASSSPWFFGPYGFALENVRPTRFIQCKGALGFFTPDLSLANQDHLL